MTTTYGSAPVLAVVFSLVTSACSSGSSGEGTSSGGRAGSSSSKNDGGKGDVATPKDPATAMQVSVDRFS